MNMSMSIIQTSHMDMEEKKTIVSVLSRLFLILCLLLLFAVTDSNATRPQPAYFYTRSRGRCTPQYWSSRIERWPKMVPQTSTVSKMFGSSARERYRSDLTILESTGRNDDENAYGVLLKEGSAALLNSYTRDKFPFQPWQVKTLLIQALVSEDSARLQAQQFSIANHACDYF